MKDALDEKAGVSNSIADSDWDKPMVCPIDPKALAECEACQ